MQNLVLPASLARLAAARTSSAPMSFSAFNPVSSFHDDDCAQ
jgi:hypothetical protein